MRSLVALLLCVAAAACYRQRDFGSGKCTDYRPVCLIGDTECTTDGKGCRICTCTCASGPCATDDGS